jgi:hypothetical protein
MDRNRIITVIWAMFAAFATYSCMYAYRKPISAGTFEDYLLFGINYKVILIITQVLGYLSAKFIGIKIISELKRANRAYMLMHLSLLHRL